MCRRHVGEGIAVQTGVCEADLLAVDLAEAADLLAERRLIDVDGVDLCGVFGVRRAVADDNAVCVRLVRLNIGKSAALRVRALVGVIADPALSVGVGDIGGMPAAVQLVRL